ncbi:MAG: PAS domain-containing protein [bacterium]
MSPLSKSDTTETIEALSIFRYTLLRRADDLLQNETAAVDGENPALQGVSGLLITSLEELKVAEEELRAQNTSLLAQRAAIDERTRHYHQLFLHSPAPTLITDIFATVHEANFAAGKLFKRDRLHLERKPLAALIAPTYRDEFRRKFGYLSSQNGVRDWRLSISRVGDLPIDINATVKLVPKLGPTASGVLYWMFALPAGSEDAPFEW